MEQLDLFPHIQRLCHLTVAEWFDLIWRFHLKDKPSARPFNSNRKAICKNIGHIQYHALTEPDVVSHLDRRKATGVGPQTIRHDLKLLTLIWNLSRKWKRRKYVIAGIDMSLAPLPDENPVIDIKKPKTRPRTKIVPPDEFARWIEHCPERLKINSCFALFTGLTRCDLERLRPSQYNPYNDCLEVQRHKTGETESIPVPDCCRAVILEAIRLKKEFILDFTNHDQEVEATRKASGVYFWWGRDLRKTLANEIWKRTKDPKAVQKAMIHADPRTAQTHYIIDSGEDLRPHIREMEKQFFC